jgi:uncharacterized membrane protein YoaK (UPF0700 family)
LEVKVPDSATTIERAARSPLPVILLVALAGGIDALMILHSKQLLAVYMTGNSTKLGQSVVQGAWTQAGPLLAIIASFLCATTLGAWLGAKASHWRAAALLMLTAVLLLIAAPFAGDQYSLGVICLIAAAMGIINQARADQPGVTFITGILVRTGRQLA